MFDAHGEGSLSTQRRYEIYFAAFQTAVIDIADW
jgi:hypothetical protein